MRYLSVCSGIEAATVAWHPLGWRPFAFSEIEKFPSQVLAHHYPDVPNFGDMTKFKEWPDANVDVLVGGTPCQSYSIAGLRKGLDDPRGNLMLTFGAVAAKYRPKWMVWENVPGVLSSNGGRDFGTFLGMLAELGYGFAYRVLDAQYFGVPQRRRRVFVVGCLGDWRSAAAVLFERESLSGHPAPSRETGQGFAADIAPSIVSSGRGVERVGDTRGQDPVGAKWPADVACTLNAAFGDKLGLEDQHINGGAPLFVPAYGIPGNWIGRKPENGGNAVEPMLDVAPCLTKTDQHAVAFQHQASTTQSMNPSEVSPTLDKSKTPALIRGMQVRRLTPVECARLQGFPDDYLSQVPGASDSAMYKALGNSFAVPVVRWIGQRIQMVHELQSERIAA